MSSFEPVRTKKDLALLDESEIVDGYLSAEAGDPEPGENRGRAFWHGWRTRMMDMGLIEIDDAHRQLVHDVAPEGKMKANPSCRDCGTELTDEDIDSGAVLCYACWAFRTGQ